MITTATRFLVVVFGISLAVACSKASNPIASEDAYLKCEGTIAIFRDGPLQLVEKQEIAAHIKGTRISFSGNDLLSGENIQICKNDTYGDQPYFDSESCDGGAKSDPKRKYGTHNRITGSLDITSGVSDNGASLLTGRFKCIKIEHLVDDRVLPSR